MARTCSYKRKSKSQIAKKHASIIMWEGGLFLLDLRNFLVYDSVIGKLLYVDFSVEVTELFLLSDFLLMRTRGEQIGII